jgi:FkbM family methyltransferase
MDFTPKSEIKIFQKIYILVDFIYILIMKIDLSSFDWGPTSDHLKEYLMNEIFNPINNGENSDYEKIFQVEENDIVVDIGSTVGDFPYSVLHKKPKHIYVVEPIITFFDVLKKNLEGHPVSFTNAAISSERYMKISWDGQEQDVRTLTFKEFIEQNRLSNINFLKIDCEGGEYSILTEENLSILKNIPKIVIECHLGYKIQKEQFRNFRDNVLPHFENYQIMSLDFFDIKWDLWNEHFLDYYVGVYLYIDNR